MLSFFTMTLSRIVATSAVLIPSVKYKEFVTKISQIDLSLRVIALKDEISTEDKLLILTELTEIKRILTGMDTFGHDDQKLEEEE